MFKLFKKRKKQEEDDKVFMTTQDFINLSFDELEKIDYFNLVEAFKNIDFESGSDFDKIKKLYNKYNGKMFNRRNIDDTVFNVAPVKAIARAAGIRSPRVSVGIFGETTINENIIDNYGDLYSNTDLKEIIAIYSYCKSLSN